MLYGYYEKAELLINAGANVNTMGSLDTSPLRQVLYEYTHGHANCNFQNVFGLKMKSMCILM